MRRRFDALNDEPLFHDQELIEDHDRFAEDLPLMAEGRDFSTPVSAIRNPNGTDVNFGALTKQYLAALSDRGTEIRYGHEVKNITREGSKWVITVKNMHTGDTRTVRANFVFVGAGGGALHLLQASGIPESKGFGGFPVSGVARCTNEELIEKHSRSRQGVRRHPPMSVPHLDTASSTQEGPAVRPLRRLTPKFLSGASSPTYEVAALAQPTTLLGVGVHEMGLTKYLITGSSRTTARESLREYVPNARDEDWRRQRRQRVQVIKPAKALKFGTRVRYAVINPPTVPSSA